MFHNVLMTTLAPLRDTNEVNCWDTRPITRIWPEIQQEKLKDASIKRTIKKRKRNRTMFTTEQVKVLEKVFARTKYIDVERRREISECLQIEQKCIKIWFQNRRMKEKKELSESCDSMSESHVSNVESVSPPLESPQLPHNEPDVNCPHPYVHNDVRRSQYYYNTPNCFKPEVHQNKANRFETFNNPTIPEHFNYNNSNFNLLRSNAEYSTQYYQPQADFQYHYNTGDVNNHYIAPNVRDWPANIFDTSYF